MVLAISILPDWVAMVIGPSSEPLMRNSSGTGGTVQAGSELEPIGVPFSQPSDLSWRRETCSN